MHDDPTLDGIPRDALDESEPEPPALADVPGASTASVGTLGPCPTCGSERLIRTVQSPVESGIGVRVHHVVDCGQCPTYTIGLHPPSGPTKLLPY